MKRIILFFSLFVTMALVSSCNKPLVTPYDHPFFYIHLNNTSEITIQASRNETVDYKVYFSTKQQFEAIALTYTIVVGDGLKEGVDFEVLTPKDPLVFKPGFVEMPIRIKWISNPIDASKDNSVTIKLLTNDKNITVGMPGPDKKQSSFKIVKI